MNTFSAGIGARIDADSVSAEASSGAKSPLFLSHRCPQVAERSDPDVFVAYRRRSIVDHFLRDLPETIACHERSRYWRPRRDALPCCPCCAGAVQGCDAVASDARRLGDLGRLVCCLSVEPPASPSRPRPHSEGVGVETEIDVSAFEIASHSVWIVKSEACRQSYCYRQSWACKSAARIHPSVRASHG